MRLAFLGSPEVATIALRRLLASQHEVAVVVSQPDRKRGRGGALSPSPVKKVALEAGIPVTDKMRDISDHDIDVAVVAAFGRLIPKALLDQFTFLNVHPSLLPRWRGAAPVEHTILAGDTKTGVCVMQLAEEMDSGPLYRVIETAIEPHEHAGHLLHRLFESGSDALVDVLDSGLGEPEPQQGEPTFAPKFAAEDTLLDFHRSAAELDRVVRIDRAWTTFRGKRLLVLDSAAEGGTGVPGLVQGAVVGTGKGVLRLLKVKPEGKPEMSAADWVKGARFETGERLGLRP